MILDDLAAAASENLLYTYFELGRASVKSRIWQDDGFRACVGEIEHPICNFAANLILEADSAQRLARVALDRSTFSVYVTPMDRPANVADVLQREGFVRSYRLVQMVADRSPYTTRNVLTRATTRFDRLQASLFMVDQFFEKQGHSFRQQVADATARALPLEILTLRRDNKILGAALVSFREGMAGIYNVCIDTSFRGLGLGTSMIREILSVCSMRGIPATLQCDPKLEKWYSTSGFRKSGEVDVFSLPKPEPGASQTV